MKYSRGLSESFINQYKDQTPPWGPLGYVTYKRTYARMTEEGISEEWWQTCARACQGLIELEGKFRQDELQYLYHCMFNLKGTVSGRALWQLGTETVRNVGGDSLQNCFSGETEIITSEGLKRFDECADEEVLLTKTPSGREWVTSEIKCFGRQRLWRVVFNDGEEIFATPDHQWLVVDGGNRIPTTALKDRCVPGLWEPPTNMEEEGFAHGFVFGDGNLRSDKKFSEVPLFGSKVEVLGIIQKYGKVGTWKSGGEEVPWVGKMRPSWKSLPKNPTRKYCLGFIMGLVAADGNVRNSIRIHNASKELLTGVRRLAQQAGLICRPLYLDATVNPFNGLPRELWCFSISTSNIDKSMLIRSDQMRAFKRSKTRKSHRVVFVGPTDKHETVYCAQVPTHHNFTLANGAVTGNCWHVTANDLSAFTFTFNQLMLGGGVGFNVLPEFVYELPPVQFNPPVSRTEEFDCDFIVPDNREGWVELLYRIFDSFFWTGKPLHYNTRAIRSAGRLIRGFGGTASGSEPLVEGMKNIVRILRNRWGQKLRPIDCMDIMNIIGKIVVSGNVRRSSQIAIGDPHDFLFIGAKDWTKRQVPEWRTMSNNSVAANSVNDLLPEFWRSGYESEGEAYGLINLKNCRRFGRIADGVDYRPDHGVVGVNPCAEITLWNKEPCNLGECFLPNIKGLNEWKKVLEVLYRAAKTISMAPFSDPETHEIVQRNHRLGIGLTGYMQSRWSRSPETLTAGYRHLEQLDESYSREIGVNKSIKLTTVKPSGTLSLLPGVTPGKHAAIARYMYRTMRMSANHPMVDICREHGHRVEPRLNLDGSNDHATMVVYFPVKTPDDAVLADEMNVIDELNIQKDLQTYWADNAVSATQYFRREDVPAIKEWLGNHYESSVKSTSFLLKNDHGFAQAPYIPISKEDYYRESSKIRPIIHAVMRDQTDDCDPTLECDGGSCPVK